MRDGANTLTITLGNSSSANPTNNTASVAIFTPESALGISGTISSPGETQF